MGTVTRLVNLVSPDIEVGTVLVGQSGTIYVKTADMYNELMPFSPWRWIAIVQLQKRRRVFKVRDLRVEDDGPLRPLKLENS